MAAEGFGVDQTLRAIDSTLDAFEIGAFDEAEALDRFRTYFNHIRALEPNLWGASSNGRHAPQLPTLVSAFDAPEPAPLEWCFRGLIPAGQPGGIIGPPGAGKDSIFCALAIAKASGRAPFNHDGFRVTEPSNVVIVSAEDQQAMILSRLHALVRGAGVDPRDTLSRIHVLGAEAGFALTPEWAAHLTGEITRVSADLVMVGPLREVMAGSENDSEAVQPIIARIRKIGVDTGAAIAVNHHATKPKEGATKADRIRGSSAIHAFMRWALWVEAMPDNRVLCECIKLTVAAPPEPLILQREITSGPDGSWWSARFDAVQRDILARTDAERAVREVLQSAPGSTSTEIRTYCKELKIKPPDVSKAMNTLERLKVIKSDPGPRGAKFWRLAETSDHPASPGHAG